MSDIAKSRTKIQQPSLQFNQPVSEASAGQLGATINYLLDAICPVGTVIYSYLTLAELNAELGNPTPSVWVLADGVTSIVGSRLHTIKGYTVAPVADGLFPRGVDQGSGYNPDGPLAPGTITPDRFKSHNHNYQTHTALSPPLTQGLFPGNGLLGPFGSSVTGDAETAPKSVSLTAFVRIN